MLRYSFESVLNFASEREALVTSSTSLSAASFDAMVFAFARSIGSADTELTAAKAIAVSKSSFLIRYNLLGLLVGQC